MYLEFGGSTYRIQFVRKYPRTYAVLYKKSDNGSFINTKIHGSSKCSKHDKFSKYEGKRIALDRLLIKITEQLNLIRQDRISIWEQFYKMFGMK